MGNKQNMVSLTKDIICSNIVNPTEFVKNWVDFHKLPPTQQSTEQVSPSFSNPTW